MKYYLLILSFSILSNGFCQVPDAIYTGNIKTPLLYVSGNQTAYPVIRLNTGDKLDLQFDDVDANFKNYSYTYQLCNSDWSPVIISQMDYLNGFSQVRITDYRYSSVALTRYTHYEASVPDRNCVPTRSGNYLLKVFLDGDTSKLAFTKRFLVISEAATVGASILQPFNPQYFHTHQKIQFTVNTGALSISSPFQQIKVVILQNYRWDNCIHDIKPSFFNANEFRYNNEEDCLFPAGKEWRWLDLQSFRYQSDRILTANYFKNATEIFLKPDPERTQLPYLYFKDYNGLFLIQTTESINPFWQTDYASVHFKFVPPGKIAFANKDVYLMGQLTGYGMDDSAKMRFNEDKGMYETTLFLKQGYYYYSYVTVNSNDPARKASFEFTEGNNMETENDYTILVYYRQLGGRADELVGMAKVNSYTGRPGLN